MVGDGDTVSTLSLEGEVGSTRGLSGFACARSRDNDDGPALGDEFARVRTGNKCDVGGRVTVNASSTSDSGTTGGISGGLATKVTDPSMASLALGIARDNVRRFWLVG